MWEGLDGGWVHKCSLAWCLLPASWAASSVPSFSVSVMLIMPLSLLAILNQADLRKIRLQILSLRRWSQRCWLQWWAVLQEITCKFYTHALVALWRLDHICWSCLPWLCCRCWPWPCASRLHVPQSRWTLSSSSLQIPALISFLLCWLLHSASDELLPWQLEPFCWLAFTVWTWDTSFELPGSVVFQRVSGHQVADSAGASLQMTSSDCSSQVPRDRVSLVAFSPSARGLALSSLLPFKMLLKAQCWFSDPLCSSVLRAGHPPHWTRPFHYVKPPFARVFDAGGIH